MLAYNKIDEIFFFDRILAAALLPDAMPKAVSCGDVQTRLDIKAVDTSNITTRYAAVSKLIEQGACIDEYDRQGVLTPAGELAKRGHFEAACFLMENFAASPNKILVGAAYYAANCHKKLFEGEGVDEKRLLEEADDNVCYLRLLLNDDVAIAQIVFGAAWAGNRGYINRFMASISINAAPVANPNKEITQTPLGWEVAGYALGGHEVFLKEELVQQKIAQARDKYTQLINHAVYWAAIGKHRDLSNYLMTVHKAYIAYFIQGSARSGVIDFKDIGNKFFNDIHNKLTVIKFLREAVIGGHQKIIRFLMIKNFEVVDLCSLAYAAGESGRLFWAQLLHNSDGTPVSHIIKAWFNTANANDEIINSSWLARNFFQGATTSGHGNFLAYHTRQQVFSMPLNLKLEKFVCYDINLPLISSRCRIIADHRDRNIDVRFLAFFPKNLRKLILQNYKDVIDERDVETIRFAMLNLPTYTNDQALEKSSGNLLKLLTPLILAKQFASSVVINDRLFCSYERAQFWIKQPVIRSLIAGRNDYTPVLKNFPVELLCIIAMYLFSDEKVTLTSRNMVRVFDNRYLLSGAGGVFASTSKLTNHDSKNSNQSKPNLGSAVVQSVVCNVSSSGLSHK